MVRQSENLWEKQSVLWHWLTLRLETKLGKILGLTKLPA